MKNLFNDAKRHIRKSFAIMHGRCNHNLESNSLPNGLPFTVLVFIACIFISACQKQNTSSDAEQAQLPSNIKSDANAVMLYDGVSDLTSWQLQQARAATAKYRNIENAVKDGYADIEVDVEHMGHHFMKTAIVDSVFNITQPEILVYNMNKKGKQELVAVEYAVPLTYSRPEGFSGSSDVWKDDSGFPLWLLHAWVWAYNPDGVFNWTNPLVHLH
jgi:hypothetical protein